jgi:hypothetical protein
MIELCILEESSHVTSHDYDIDLSEETEYLPTGSLLDAVDLDYLSTTDGVEIDMTIRSQAREDTARS